MRCSRILKFKVQTYKRMAKINFGGTWEEVVTREEFPMEKARQVLENELVAIIGYGVQGPGQALNLRDNGINVIVGQRPGTRSWDKAVADGWEPGETLFPIEEAARQGTIIQFLLSDAGQIQLWDALKKHLTPGKALYFSHGFGVTFKEQTGIIPPAGIHVIFGGAKRFGHYGAALVPARRRHQLQLCRVPGRHRAGQRKGHRPGYRHRLQAICFPPILKKKSIPIWPANAAPSWALLPVFSRPNTRCYAPMATRL